MAKISPEIISLTHITVTGYFLLCRILLCSAILTSLTLSKDCSTGNKEEHVLFIIAFDLGIQKISKQHIVVNIL